MKNVLDFNEALLRKRDQEFGQRQVLNRDEVKALLADPELVKVASAAHEERERAIDQAIYDFEVARARWRCAKNVS